MKRQQYITAVNADGTTSAAGIIHEWHDEDHLTAEWLPFSDVRYLLGAGMEPDPDSPVTPEMCEDIDLQDGRKYQLHYTWLTVAGAFAKDTKRVIGSCR